VLNNGDYNTASNEFIKWNKARVDGILKELPGLTKRRKAEQMLFNN
jgi:GH24 family phage-related lysozyme (muramidase)